MAPPDQNEDDQEQPSSSSGGGGSSLAGVTRQPGSISSSDAQKAVADAAPEKDAAEEKPSEDASSEESPSEEETGDQADLDGEDSSDDEGDSNSESDSSGEADVPLGLDPSTPEPQNDLSEKNISFSINVELHRALQKRLLKERISMRRALAGVMRWWTEEPETAIGLLRPQIQDVEARKAEAREAEARSEGEEETSPAGEGSEEKGSSFRVSEDLHNAFRVQLIDEGLYVKDAAESMVRWFVHEPAEVRSHIRPHLPAKRR